MIGPARFYRGTKDHRFQEVAKEVGLSQITLPMGANFGDLDNDGFLDFYLGTGYPDYEALMPNVMYHNQRGTKFLDVTEKGGFGHLQKGHGIAFADFDNDGDQDVVTQLGGFYRGDKFYDALFENPGFNNRWLGDQTDRHTIKPSGYRCEDSCTSSMRTVSNVRCTNMLIVVVASERIRCDS